MSREEIIALALATGAAAHMHPNSLSLERPEIAAYQELLKLLSRNYPGVDARMMEVGPGSKERREYLANQLRQSGAAEDAAVLRQSRRLLREIMARTPHAATAIFATADTVSEALATS